MALKSAVANAPGRKDPALVTIKVAVGDAEEILTFRRPTTRELTPDREVLDKISRSVSGLRMDQLFTIFVISATYRAAEGEGVVEAYKLFAELSVKNDLLFADICKQWEQAFPEFTDWFTARAQAKNDLGTAQEDSATDSDTAPSVLADSLQSSAT
jgi:hypothetical protein